MRAQHRWQSIGLSLQSQRAHVDDAWPLLATVMPVAGLASGWGWLQSPSAEPGCCCAAVVYALPSWMGAGQADAAAATI
jgi:hypothetical protein